MEFSLQSLFITQKSKTVLKIFKSKLEIVTLLQDSQHTADVYLGLLWGFLFNQQSFLSLRSYRSLTDFHLLFQAGRPSNGPGFTHEGTALNSTKRRQCRISSAAGSVVKNSTTWERKTSNLKTGVSPCASAVAVQCRENHSLPGCICYRQHTFMPGLKRADGAAPWLLPAPELAGTAIGNPSDPHSDTHRDISAYSGGWEHQGTQLTPQSPQNNDYALLIALL